MNSKKQVLFIIWSFSMGGGAEKILSNILNKIDLNKYEIDVLEYIKFNIKEEKIPFEINRLAPIIDCSNKKHRIKRRIYDKMVIKYPDYFRKKRIKKKYDVEIAFNYLIPNSLINDKSNTICWVHGDIYDLKDSPYLYNRQQHFFNKTAIIVAISKNTELSIKELYPEHANKIKKIYNGFDINEIIQASKKDCDIQLDTNSILYIGRLEERKQPIKSLECLVRLHQLGCKASLYILGKGELLDELRAYVYDKELNEYVKFLGYIDNPYPIIKQAKAIVSFSNSEGFPTIFVEGFALGVPFVSTPVGGTEELSNNGKSGIVIKTIDEGAYALKSIIDGTSTTTTDNCLKQALKYSIEKQILELEKLIDN